VKYSAVDVLSAIVAGALDGTAVTGSFNPRQPTVFAFLEALRTTPDFPDAVAAGALDAVAEAVETPPAGQPKLVDVCISSPREFYETVVFLMPILTSISEGTATFVAAADAMATLGTALSSRDSALSESLFSDYCMTSFVPLLRSRPDKRHHALRVMYAFAGDSMVSHLQMIRVLQERLSDLPTFLYCLSVLVFLEPEFDEHLLDLYFYYCKIGLSMPSPLLRAACMTMLSVIVAHAPHLAGDIMTSIAPLATDTWWEVRAQLLIVCSSVLQLWDHTGAPLVGTAESGADTAAAVASATKLACSLLAPADSSPAVLRVGVSYCSGALHHHPALSAPYAAAVAAIPAPARRRLLRSEGQTDDLGIVAASGGKYRLPLLPPAWSVPAVCDGLASLVVDRGLSSLDVGHVDLIYALALSAARLPDPAGALSDGLQPVKRHWMVALADPAASAVASAALRVAVVDCGLSGWVLSDENLPLAITLAIAPDAGPPAAACVDAITELLTGLHSNGFGDAVAAAVRGVAEFAGDAINNAPGIAALL
jgi:hypothetical protein